MMTTYQLASAVAVIKNMMVAGKLTQIEAIHALWDLVNEAAQDAHYVRGMSATVDRLLNKGE